MSTIARYLFIRNRSDVFLQSHRFLLFFFLILTPIAAHALRPVAKRTVRQNVFLFSVRKTECLIIIIIIISVSVAALKSKKKRIVDHPILDNPDGIKIAYTAAAVIYHILFSSSSLYGSTRGGLIKVSTPQSNRVARSVDLCAVYRTRARLM